MKSALGISQRCGMVRLHVWRVCAGGRREGRVMRHIVGLAACAVCLFACRCLVCVVVTSLQDNKIGDVGAAAIGAGLRGVPSLTSLKYAMQAWVMCIVGRGQGG